MGIEPFLFIIICLNARFRWHDLSGTSNFVFIPAKAGTHSRHGRDFNGFWTPAFAGVTLWEKLELAELSFDTAFAYLP
jgi:hypothetical protein